MARFHFRLSTLLKLRESERQQRQIELAQAYEAERLVLEQLATIASEIAAAKERVRKMSSPGEIPVDELLELQRYGLQLRMQSTAMTEKLGVVRNEIDRRRQILVEANRQVRTLEKLREKQSALFELERSRQEQKALDEFGQKRLTASDDVDATTDLGT